MTAELNHPALGQIKGKLGDGVLQFLGVKYASLKDRFAPSEIYDHKDSKVIDAIKLGPTVISPPACAMEFGFIQQSLPLPETHISELDGLNLNISMPLLNGDIPSVDQKLPVFVFVHGGGYAVGSNTWPQYDLARIVKLSSEMRTPVIGVAIGYRLGLPGFLTSEEMRKEGYVSNNGLKDQANALRWVKKYIGGFGGDSDSVTYIGESAGAVAGTMHLHSKEPLFNRMVSMSGTSLFMKPLPPPVSEFVYASVIELFGLKELSATEQVKALLELPVEKLLSVPPGVPLMPVINESLQSALTFKQMSSREHDPSLDLPGRKWCKELLIGDCQFDGSILAWVLGPRTVNIAQSFCTSIDKSLAEHPSAAEKLRHAYKITPDLDDAIVLRNILQFATDICFLFPAITFAKGWPGKAHLYHFNEPNPWNGQWKGEATHVLDVAFLFQNFNEHLQPEQKAVAVKFAQDVIGFVNGKCEWKKFDTGVEGARMYGPSKDGVCGGYVDGVASEQSGRQKTIFELAEAVGVENLSATWSNFVQGQ